MYYYKFHIGDFRSGCANMSQLERWLYRDLLDILYDTEDPLPLDSNKLFRMVGARTQDQKDAVQAVIEMKFNETPDGYVNGRFQTEMDLYRRKADSARKANQTRWASDLHQKSDARSDLKSDASQILTINQEPIKKYIGGSTPIPKKGSTESVSVDALTAEGVDEKDAQDWLRHRASQRKPLTPRAWENFKRAATDFGGTVAEAVKLCADKQWLGIDHDGGRKALGVAGSNGHDFAGPNCAN